jgi:hypothetical protein
MNANSITILDTELARLTAEATKLRSRLSHVEFVIAGLEHWRGIIAGSPAPVIVESEGTEFKMSFYLPAENKRRGPFLRLFAKKGGNK